MKTPEERREIALAHLEAGRWAVLGLDTSDGLYEEIFGRVIRGEKLRTQDAWELVRRFKKRDDETDTWVKELGNG